MESSSLTTAAARFSVLLKDGEKSPSEIATHFDFSLPALSTHLRVLRDAGLVKERKEGQRKLILRQQRRDVRDDRFSRHVLGRTAAQAEAVRRIQV